MKEKNDKSISLNLYFSWPLVFSGLFVLLDLVLFLTDFGDFLKVAPVTLVLIAVSLFLYFHTRRKLRAALTGMAAGLAGTMGRLAYEMDMPSCATDTDGQILWKNAAFDELLAGHGTHGAGSQNIRALFPDIKEDALKLVNAGEPAVVHSSHRDHCYRIEMRKGAFSEQESARRGLRDTVLEADMPLLFCLISDETELLLYKRLYQDGKPCEGYIYIDNYDEVLKPVEEARGALFSALVDRRISSYIASMNGIINKLEKDKYFFIVDDLSIGRMIEDRFSLLEEVKEIHVGNELSLTLSIGAGRGGSHRENVESARAAMDLALGRGGDQAVLKDGDEIQYFGGKSSATTKNTRVKARVKAQAFRELLNQKDRLIIMGHKISDVDAFGASIGIWRIATAYGKKAFIVCGDLEKSVLPLKELFDSNSAYPADMFVDKETAKELVDENTALVVVDVSRPAYSEVPELIDLCETIVVIDHHRLTSDSVENATLSYIEPFSSSASEMVTEILQYMGEDLKILPLDASALYSGILIDTQSFLLQAGVRTFEAAAFLRRKGADINMIRKMLREGFTDYKAKMEAVNRTEIYLGQFALAVCDPTGTQSPTVVGAQAANTLLEIKNIKASVVFTPLGSKIYLSARSIDEVNVQRLMEKLGGGGRKAAAGVQLSDVTVEEAVQQVKNAIDEMISEGEIN